MMQGSGCFLTCEEVAQQLRVSVETVWRWVRIGKLAAVKIGTRNYRIRQSDLAALVGKGKTKRDVPSK